MPYRQSGNESDVRLRPGSSALSSDVAIGENPGGSCADIGTQTDIATPPTGATTPTAQLLLRYDWTTLAGCCPRGVDLRCVERFLYRLVANHFVRADTICEPELKKYTFTDDPTTTKLRIAINSQFDLAGGERYPAIIIKRGATQSQRIVMGDLAEPREDLGENASDSHFVRFYQGTHSLLALSNNAVECELFGQELLDLLTVVSPIVRSTLPFHDFQVSGLGELGVLDEVGNLFAVPVSVTYAYEYGWTLTNRTQPLGSLAITTNITQG